MKRVLEDLREKLDIECDCMNMDHMIRFSYWPEDGAEHPDDFLYMASSLNPNRKFIYRLWAGIKYIFLWGDARSQVMFEETVMTPSDGRDLTQFLQRYNDYIDRNHLFR